MAPQSALAPNSPYCSSVVVVDVSVVVLDEVDCEVEVVRCDVDFEVLLADESAELLPLVVAIRATTMPMASTLAIAMIVFALLLMRSAYAVVRS